jgi:hypothetical protein
MSYLTQGAGSVWGSAGDAPDGGEMLAVLERFVQDHANCDLDWAEFCGMALRPGERGEAPKWLARGETDG